MNEENKQEQPLAFDPSTLSPEAQAWFEKEKERYADSRVTGAVKTTEQRVKTEMLNDQSLREQIRKEVELEANLSAEDKIRLERQKVDNELKNLKKESNAFLVKKELLSYGFDEKAIETLTGLVVTEDKDTTMAKLQELTSTFNTTLTARVEREKLALLEQAGSIPPAGGNPTQSEKADYLASFLKAKASNDGVTASRILRESQSKGIDIFK